MIAFGTESAGAVRRRGLEVDGGCTFYKSEWMENGSDPDLSPTVSLIEQPAGYEFMPHFHRQNQFQVFVGGSGSIGSHEIKPVMVHYAGAYTGYGPLIAGDVGIKYFTIRPVCEAGFIPVAELADKRIRGPKRHAHSEPISLSSDEERRAITSPVEAFAIARDDDGLAARNILIPPMQSLQIDHLVNSQGYVLFVLSGSIKIAGHTYGLGRWEQVYATSDERPIEVTAGELGAQFLCLHVPVKSAAYKHAPAVVARSG